ncbi:uncharacterized protein LOC123317827 [Coccinella septempunctata]|uniref:uncharacterized protein LOC123317827 n=1 Tax=Coccinella septempunctata TaxID=41139 RepID=UPI001D072228|nr:uncharacterized protein LOC123317827 [Coccinella septempunctata]
MIKHFIRKEYISEQQGKTMFNYNAVPARFYGLPKVHKPVLSLRPIISSINTPITKLSALTSQILSDSMDDNNSTPNQHTTDMQEGLIQNGMLGESREVSDVEADRVTTQQRDDSPTRNGMPGGTGELASLEETQQIATHEGEIAAQEDLLDEAGEFTRVNSEAHITPSNRDRLIRNGMPDETLETTTDEEERRLIFVAFPLIPQGKRRNKLKKEWHNIKVTSNILERAVLWLNTVMTTST